MTSRSLGAQCTWATSVSSGRWLRSIPMTGVMPLPAVRKSTFAGAGRREGEVAGGLVEHDEGARAGVAHEVGGDLALGDRLGRDGDAARRDAGGGRAVGAVGEAVGAPVAHAVDVDADPDVLAGDVPEPAAAGADDDGGGVGGLGADLDDAAAQVGAGAHRVEEVEVVVGDQRRGEGLGHPAGAAHQPAERAGGVGAEARPGGPRGGGRSVAVDALTYASVTYVCVSYDTVGSLLRKRSAGCHPPRCPTHCASATSRARRGAADGGGCARSRQGRRGVSGRRP